MATGGAVYICVNFLCTCARLAEWSASQDLSAHCPACGFDPDGFVVNIGVDFEITCYSNFNKSEVIANCLKALQDYFNIDKWTFNKPINISEIELTLANIEGVMSVPSVVISNLCAGDGTYSPNRYNISQATQGKIIYPSLDPCVFEVKYPTKDIKGRAL